MRSRFLGLVAVGLLAAPLAGHTASFTVRSVDNTPACGQQLLTSSSPATVSGTCGGFDGLYNFGTASSAARATYGAVGGSATATSTGGFNGVNGGAYAQSNGGDIYFSYTGPGSAPSESFMTSMNFNLKGVMGISGSLPNASGVEVIFDVGGFGRYRYLMGGNGVVQQDSSFASTVGTIAGDISKLEFDLTLTTQQFGVNLSAPFVVPFSIDVRAGASQNIPSTAYANFYNSATFATGRPVFNLPDGYTANAGDYLVNNRYGAVVNPVPEPGTLALLGLGFAGLGLSRRRKTH